ncbi:hypothetical protein [Pseudomonas sp. 5Ae-yellow]|uniref:hypothetical protein n=1 Tax=Pseudomonas sp. 5Ae-yellow TaxID=2759848 RepID=UPI0015F4B257|nr:hypothetical protein [Pseudomonas sp. 5Ae-yellow]MBA6421312.1 hypothetical protein [Pseudomonas sp. 5Ae-yellow]
MHFLHRSPKSILYYFLLIWLPLALVAALVVALLANSQIKASTVIAGAGQRAQVERAVSLLQSSIDIIRGDALYLANHVEFQHSEAFGLTQSDQRARSFADFLRFHAKYEQIRFIDTQGQEQVRVERQTDGLVITPNRVIAGQKQPLLLSNRHAAATEICLFFAFRPQCRERTNTATAEPDHSRCHTHL